ncbi:hypothetical protein [Microbacterium sp.]|uniref:hypothetical protein n=1 Tax=Microbacterium sp. TaxID=51671 RepID=UPI00289E074B|nr:hypothetical protein [Microbacterium sp.]
MRVIMQVLASVAAVAALILGAVVTAPPAAATSAAPLPLEYSLDGVTWSDTAPAVVPAAWQPVPGSTMTTSLHVRSIRAAESRVALFVGAAQSPSRALLDATTITGRLSTIDMGAVDPCRPLDSASLTEGQSAVFTITVTVSPLLDAAQSRPLTVLLDASMSDAAVHPVGSGCASAAQPASPTDLAATGGSGALVSVVAVIGLGLVMFGMAFRRRSRRLSDARD